MIKLVVPSLEDMWFREQLINDEKTMEFNKKWGGTIHFPKDKWESWYDYWVEILMVKGFIDIFSMIIICLLVR